MARQSIPFKVIKGNTYSVPLQGIIPNLYQVRVEVDEESITVGELVSMAEELAGELGRKVKFMAGGHISNEHKEPVPLGYAGPKFSRGFIRYPTGAIFSNIEQGREILSVNIYHASSDE